jgi:hypothetical protein
MNRTLLIQSPPRPHPIRALAIRALASEPVETRDPEWLEDLKLFATGWLGGLVFFGTFLA